MLIPKFLISNINEGTSAKKQGSASLSQNEIVLSNLCLAEVLHLRIQCAQKSLQKQ